MNYHHGDTAENRKIMEKSVRLIYDTDCQDHVYLALGKEMLSELRAIAPALNTCCMEQQASPQLVDNAIRYNSKSCNFMFAPAIPDKDMDGCSFVILERVTAENIVDNEGNRKKMNGNVLNGNDRYRHIAVSTHNCVNFQYDAEIPYLKINNKEGTYEIAIMSDRLVKSEMTRKASKISASSRSRCPSTAMIT